MSVVKMIAITIEKILLKILPRAFIIYFGDWLDFIICYMSDPIYFAAFILIIAKIILVLLNFSKIKLLK